MGKVRTCVYGCLALHNIFSLFAPNGPPGIVGFGFIVISKTELANFNNPLK